MYCDKIGEVAAAGIWLLVSSPGRDARCAQAWSSWARDGRHGQELAGEQGAHSLVDGVGTVAGERAGAADGDGRKAGVEGGQLQMMEDWVKDLTDSVNVLKKENAALRAQQQQQQQQAPEDVKGCRTLLESWRCYTVTARRERRGVLLEFMWRWRESCPKLSAGEDATAGEGATPREQALQEKVAEVQRQLSAAQALALSEQETSEKLVFLLTDKETSLEALRRDLALAQAALRERAMGEEGRAGEEGSQDGRERLAAAEAKVSLLEEHVDQVATRTHAACTHRESENER